MMLLWMSLAQATKNKEYKAMLHNKNSQIDFSWLEFSLFPYHDSIHGNRWKSCSVQLPQARVAVFY